MSFFKSGVELCDVVSHIIYCMEDSTLMMTLEANSSEFWIPSSKVVNGNSWYSQSTRSIEDMFGTPFKTQKLLRLYKIWIPQHTVSFIYHCIFELEVNQEQKKKSKSTYGKYRGKVWWVQDAELIRMLVQESLRSPEILELYHIAKGGVPTKLLGGVEISAPIEFIYCGNLIEIADNILIKSSEGTFEQIIESASFSKDIQTAIFKEFLFLCFPAIYMCQQIFVRLATQLGWSKEESVFIFRAADMSGRCGLSYRDVVYVLAALEPTTSHGGTPAELRCRYIFRFFDRDRDGSLNFTEFKNLVIATRRAKKQPLDATSVSTEAESNFRNIGLNVQTGSLSMPDFLRAVGDLKLRGTSQIFRSPVSIIQYLQELDERENKMQKKTSKFDDKQYKTEGRRDSPNISTKRLALKSGDYELGEHTIRLQKSGTLISIDQIWNVGSAVSASSTGNPTLSNPTRRFSQDQFSQTSLSNEVLKCLRYLTHVNKNLKPPVKGAKAPESYSWGQLDSMLFAKNFINICSQIREILKSEPRMLDIQSPVYIMGDLHGNLVSLLYFEKILWHLGPGLCPCNLLFLGDYVDRGAFSLEVISYLFCYKVQAPGKLMLVRGNHEIREIQKMFTFYSECVNKFGEKIGIDVWNAINSAFDTMPVCATIDGKIFCCHGGVPPPWLCPTVAAINTIPCPLSNPDEQSALAWELMWNDPICKQKQISEDVALELVANEGFAINRRRGTAHVFSVEALERFLNTNGYSHLIRAHEVAQSGFNVQQKGKLLTVFSSSKYCGGINEAACILADQGKLRILRLEPS